MNTIRQCSYTIRKLKDSVASYLATQLIDNLATLIDSLGTLIDSLGTLLDSVATLIDSLATL